MNRLAAGWERHLPYLLLGVRIVAALLFFQHGAQKLMGFTGTAPVESYLSQRGIAGLLEVVGPVLLALGCFTRATAFLLCGEMAVAYFTSWAPRGFWPITNGGEEAVAFCYFFLWIVTYGPGAWSVDGWLSRRPGRRSFEALMRRLSSWEPYARAILRIIIGFLIALHGARKALGLLTVIVGGRVNVPPLALDGLPALTGYFDLIVGLLLIAGFLTRPVAALMAIELLIGYLVVSAPRGPWPIRNGGGEALIEVAILAVFVVAGAGEWSVDRIRDTSGRARRV